MRQLLQVSVAIVFVHCLAVAATPARAENGVVLVGCDLFAQGGPKVTLVQSGGVANSDGPIARRRFVAITGFRSNEFVGRDCAEILSEVLADGLDFSAMEVFGDDAGFGLWFFKED